MHLAKIIKVYKSLIEKEEGYFETVIVSGKFIGVDSLALDLADIMDSTFIFNNIDNKGKGTMMIADRRINYEHVIWGKIYETKTKNRNCAWK